MCSLKTSNILRLRVVLSRKAWRIGVGCYVALFWAFPVALTQQQGMWLQSSCDTVTGLAAVTAVLLLDVAKTNSQDQ